MKNLLLLISLPFVAVSKVVVKNDIFNYNFHCGHNHRHTCSRLHEKLVDATNSLSKILDETSKVNFDVYVDDISKYRINRSMDTLALAIDNTNFAPLNPKNNNTISPYPNAKSLKSNKNRDFVLLLNNFKSNKNHKPLQDNVILIITELIEGLNKIKKLPYPYNIRGDAGDYTWVTDIDPVEMALTSLNVRKNVTLINEIAQGNDEEAKKFIEANRLPEIIHWKDILISKGMKHFPRRKYEYKRIVALGDIHGDYNKLVKILRHAKLINKRNDWIGTDAILVQVGDLTDRGPDFKDIIDLFIKIREQAKKRGGIVYMLLGNHELYDLQGGYFVLSKKDIDKFGGIMEREKAISMDGKYGKLLRKELNTTMVVDDNLFVHAGLNYKFAQRGIDEINRHVQEVLSTVPSFDELLNDYRQNKTHLLYQDPLFNMNDGPLWTRFYNEKPEEEVCEELEKVLKVTKSKRMIVGHAIQEFGQIRTRCNEKLILIDVALSECLGDFFGYVEILNDKREIWARYHHH